MDDKSKKLIVEIGKRSGLIFSFPTPIPPLPLPTPISILASVIIPLLEGITKLMQKNEELIEELILLGPKGSRLWRDIEEIKKINLSNSIIYITPGTTKSLKDATGTKVYDLLKEIKNNSNRKHFIYIVELDSWKDKQSEIKKIIKRDLRFLCHIGIVKGNSFIFFVYKADIYTKPHNEIKEEFINDPDIGIHLQNIKKLSNKFRFIIGNPLNDNDLKTIFQEISSMINDEKANWLVS